MIPFHSQDNFANALRSSLEPPASWFVVINHHEARVFRSAVRGTLPEKILPPKADEFFRHAHNSKDFTTGREKPDANSFFGLIATALKDASQFLILGSGTGTANESEQFIAWLEINHRELLKRLIGSATIDEHHLTDAELLAKARNYYATPHVVSPPVV
jgi:hypothetical protein